MTFSESYWPATSGDLPLIEMTAGGLLRDAAEDAPDDLALLEGVPDVNARRRWTYGELLVASEQVARALAARFDPGERLAVWAVNIPEWVLVEYGAALAGLTLVTVNPVFVAKELEYVLRQSRAAGIIMAPELGGVSTTEVLAGLRAKLPELRELISFADWDVFFASAGSGQTLPQVEPRAPAQIQYTSGTTGFPKGATLHHRGLVNNARLGLSRGGLRRGDCYLNPMPLFHTAGCGMGVLGSAVTRSTQILVRQFDPALCLELIETERVAYAAGVPTMLIAMMEHPDFTRRDLSSLKYVTSGGALVPAELVRRIEANLAVDFTIVYGQTESWPIITMTNPHDSLHDKAETIGSPLPHTDAKIIDPVTGDIVPVGEVGEFCTRGYLVMDGYFDMPEHTAEAIDADGWLHTGDLCAMDERGYFTVEGRLKDMIIRGGENVYPKEIEELLFAHPSVADAAVIGVPDDKYGEQVAAFVRLNGGRLRHEELVAYCREHLARHKTPRYWVSVEEWPMTGSGKIQKFVLQDRWMRGRYADRAIRI